jgi:hypothetical protein
VQKGTISAGVADVAAGSTEGAGALTRGGEGLGEQQAFAVAMNNGAFDNGH